MLFAVTFSIWILDDTVTSDLPLGIADLESQLLPIRFRLRISNNISVDSAGRLLNETRWDAAISLRIDALLTGKRE